MNTLRFTCLAIASFAALSASHSSGADSHPQRPTVNVKDFGALGDCRHVSDGAMNAGSPILTSASAHFVPQDVGKPIYVLEANSQKFNDVGDVPGAPLSTAIIEVKDAHTLILHDPARQDVKNVSVTWGADDTKAIQRAIDSLSETGGTVFFPAGMYRVVYTGGPGLKVAYSNIRLQGTGNDSALFNSTVLFKAKIKDGRTVTQQTGVPVLYCGQPGPAIENVEVDHLWLGDNGQHYDFKTWGPYGPGILGSAGNINHFSFHDLTIATTFLCGINMNSQTEGFEIHHVTVLSAGDHGFYLAGTASDGNVHHNRIIGTTSPMRQGIAIKKKTRLRVTDNEITNVEFQAIGVEGDDPSYISRDVLIANNFIHDLPAWHTDAITIFNADGVVIRNNRIIDTSWVAINLHTWKYTVANVVVKDNIITRACHRDPAFAIDVRYDPPRDLPRGAPWPGKVAETTIENNVITDCAHGICMVRVSGKNVVRGNRVENHEPKDCTGYNFEPLAEARVEFAENKGVNCKRYGVPKSVMGGGNDLK